ncbi:MAG: hypothetical protein A6F72_08680 [Cycloclasticus sp. symbiont of Poecilosclerida sp. N]|nr:MAG: hypothetical protein A6F72_08680 [Cycloclasticus sp. symbiont of Poecilosclerida sp. N]
MDKLLNSKEAKLIYRCFNGTDNLIKKDEFLAWAVDKGFLIKLEDRVLDDNIAKKLHTKLTASGFITGGFDDVWQWTKKPQPISILG